MIEKKTVIAILAGALASVAIAAEDPREVRHELMEGVGEAAKVIGGMLKGEVEYDAAEAAQSLAVFERASSQLGELFPEGSESGKDTEASPAIWDDRAGFEAALSDWQGAIADARAADLQTLEDAKPALGAVFKTCKNCHDNYRIKDE